MGLCGLFAAAGDVIVFARGVKYRAIHAVGQFDGAEDLVILSTYQLDLTEIIVAIRDDQLVGFWEEECRVWLAEPRNALKVLPLEIEDIHCLVVLGGEKQPLALEIQCEMVEIARETRQWGRCH